MSKIIDSKVLITWIPSKSNKAHDCAYKLVRDHVRTATRLPVDRVHLDANIFPHIPNLEPHRDDKLKLLARKKRYNNKKFRIARRFHFRTDSFMF